jgi:ankyrin repeat protein
VARDRVEKLRLVRDRRAQKKRFRQSASTVHPSRDSSRTSSLTTNYTGSMPCETFTVDCDTPTRPDVGLVHNGSNDLSTNQGLETVTEMAATNDEDDLSNGNGNANANSNGKHVRLSWVRSVVRSSSGSKVRPSSSLMSLVVDARSLLSTSSIRSSLISRRSSIMTKLSSSSKGALPEFPNSEDNSVRQYNSLLIKLCCANQDYCIHRRVCETFKYETLEDVMRLTGNGVKYWPDLDMASGRDIWGETALHLVARWGPGYDPYLTMRFLLDLVGRWETPFINIRNVDGNTFLHLLSYQWHLSPSSYRNTLPELIRRLAAKKFDFLAVNNGGQNFFASLIPNTYDDNNCTLAERYQIAQAFDSLLAPFDFHPIPGPTSDLKSNPISTALKTLMPNGISVGLLVVKYLTRQAEHMERESNLPNLPPILWGTVKKYERHMLMGPSVVFYGRHIGKLNELLHSDEFRGTRAEELLRPLLETGASVDDYDLDGCTPLMIIIDLMDCSKLPEDRGISLMLLLIQHGADLRIVDKGGNTVLHRAVQAGLADVVQFLIDHRVNAKLKNVRDETAHQMAINNYQRSRRDITNIIYARSEKILVRMFDKQGSKNT